MKKQIDRGVNITIVTFDIDIEVTEKNYKKYINADPSLCLPHKQSFFSIITTESYRKRKNKIK